MTRKLPLHGVVNMRTDLSGHRVPQRKAFRVRTGEQLTGNVQPLLHEVRHALVHLSDLGEATVIDLRNLSQPDNSTLQTTKGRA